MDQEEEKTERMPGDRALHPFLIIPSERMSSPALSGYLMGSQPFRRPEDDGPAQAP